MGDSLPETHELDLLENEGLKAIGPIRSHRKLREWALVLQSGDIWHTVREFSQAAFLVVRFADEAKATALIDRYEAENKNWPPKQVRERLLFRPSPVAPSIFAVLALFFFLVTGPSRMRSNWFEEGASVANLVLSSEPWRAVTALTLHSDTNHLLGNAISGTVFTAAVQRRLGPGGGSLAVLSAGALGNVANAFYHHMDGRGFHASIGASTAIFAAIGILAATQVVVNDFTEPHGHPWLRRLSPIVGGLALLGALGASPESDLGAHLFGFLSGLLVGFLAIWPLRNKQRASSLREALLGSAAVVLVVGSWALARKV